MVVWPIVSALWMAIGFVGSNTVDTLIPVNETQQQFIDKYVVKQDSLLAFNSWELRSCASTDIPYLNNVLKKEGYAIQLQEKPEGVFGVVSMLDIKVQWQNEGECTELTGQDGTVYPAVCIDRQDGNVRWDFKVAHNNPIISLKTKTDDIICMTVIDEQGDEASMLDLIERINACQQYKKVMLSYDQFIFPMIAFDQVVKLDWLCGLQVGNADRYIDQAVQQTKLHMDEKGAHAQSACALFVAECLGAPVPSIFVIDKPFLLWIMRPDVQEPIFAAYLPYDCWKNPNV